MIEVSGRSYPVEVRYRPHRARREGEEPDESEACSTRSTNWRIRRAAIAAQATSCSSCPPSATSTRRPSRCADGRSPATTRRKTEILPLYARLSIAEQQRVFQPHRNRRIVIATNVAESSLTVPGIRYVIDPGTARISRYSARDQDPAAADRAGLAGLGRSADGALRADRAGRLHPPVQRGRLRSPRPLHAARNPADQPGRGDPPDQGLPAGRDRELSRFSIRRGTRRSATATRRSSSWARSTSTAS